MCSLSLGRAIIALAPECISHTLIAKSCGGGASHPHARTDIHVISSCYTTPIVETLVPRTGGLHRLFPEGVVLFCQIVTCPVECEAYSSGVSRSGKRKFSLCALRASVVNQLSVISFELTCYELLLTTYFPSAFCA